MIIRMPHHPSPERRQNPRGSSFPVEVILLIAVVAGCMIAISAQLLGASG